MNSDHSKPRSAKEKTGFMLFYAAINPFLTLSETFLKTVLKQINSTEKWIVGV